MKARGSVRQAAWWRTVILCVLILVGSVVPAASPAHCESLEELLGQLEVVRQQLNELLVSYQTSTPEQRALWDSVMATQYARALQRFYNSLSSGDRTALDKAIREKTGYSFAQLVQMSSTVPGMVRAVNLLIDAAKGLAGGRKAAATPKPKGTTGATAPAAPGTAKTPPKPPSTAPPSGVTGVQPPSQGGAVDLRGSKELRLKLGWVLFGRTDLTDEQAQALYDEKVKKRVAQLDETLTAAKKRQETAERRLKLVDEAAEKTGSQRIRSTLQEELQEAKKERSQALKDLGGFFLKEAAGAASKKVESFLDLKDVGTGAYDMEALTLKTERTREDWEKAGQGLVGILAATSKQAGLKVVGPVASVAELAADAIYLQLADRRVRILEKSLAQNNVQEYRSRLLQQIQMESDRIQAMEGEKAMLSSGKYLDLEAIR